jgi:serine/threonine protein kinase
MSNCLEDFLIAEMSLGLLPEPVLSLSLIHLEGCEICRSRYAASLSDHQFQFARSSEKPKGLEVEIPKEIIGLVNSDLASAAAGSELLPADTWFGPYLIGRLIHDGHVTQVYEASDSRLNRRVAIKIVQQDVVSYDRSLSDQFLEEARIVAGIHHPNVVSIFDVGVYQGRPYFVMPLLEGESLRSRLQSGPVSHAETLALMLSMIDGLKAAHQNGVIHKDLKPENLWLNSSRSAGQSLIILDFGIAQVKDMPGKGVSGTPSYWSPEQVMQQVMDERTDFFALGCILFELLTGSPAWASEVRDNFRNPLEDKRLSKEIRAVLGRLLTLDPEQRYQDHESIIIDLKRVLEESRSTGNRASSRQRIALGLLLLTTCFLLVINRLPKLSDDSKPMERGQSGAGPQLPADLRKVEPLPAQTKALITNRIKAGKTLQIEAGSRGVSSREGHFAYYRKSGKAIVIADLSRGLTEPELPQRELSESEGFERIWMNGQGTMVAGMRGGVDQKSAMLKVWKIEAKSNHSPIRPIWTEQIEGRVLYDCTWVRINQNPVLAIALDRSNIRYYKFDEKNEVKPQLDSINYNYSVVTNLYDKPGDSIVLAAKNLGGLDVIDLKKKSILFSYRAFENGPPRAAWLEDGFSLLAISPDGLALSYDLRKSVERSKNGHAYLIGQLMFQMNASIDRVVSISRQFCVMLTLGKPKQVYLIDLEKPGKPARLDTGKTDIIDVLRLKTDSFGTLDESGKIVIYDIIP